MRVVLDTNVLVSGILYPYSKLASVLRLIISGEAQVAYDARILNEYRVVLSRPKFVLGQDNVNALLEPIEFEGYPVSAVPLVKHLADPDDEPFLEVAISGAVDALITGNKRHFLRSLTEGILVLDPGEFLDFFHKVGQKN